MKDLSLNLDHVSDAPQPTGNFFSPSSAATLPQEIFKPLSPIHARKTEPTDPKE